MTGSGLAGQIHLGKNHDIEVLRAFAILTVLVYHLDGVLLPDFPGTPLASFGLASGVDLFFVVSGFVIARTLLPKLWGATAPGERRTEVLAFWTKRIFRLWPTAWLWLFIALAVVASFKFEAGHLSFPTNVDATIAGVLHFANFRFADSFGQYLYGASFHFWTLSLEEQFYFLLPLLALLSGRRIVFLLPVLIAIDQLRPFSLLTILSRSSGLLIGVLIAIFSQTKFHQQLATVFRKLSRWIAFPLMIGSFALVLWTEVATPTFVQFHYGYVAAAGGLCVLLASFDRDALCPRGTWTTVMQWVGARSYAIYVIHVPIFLVVGEAIQNRLGAQLGQATIAASIAAATFLLVFVLAELNYRIIEQPLRRVGIRLANRITCPRSAPVASKTVQESA